MKKVFIVLGVVCFLVCLGCAGFLYFAFSTGSQHQQKFFTAVDSGDPKMLMELFHPALQKEVDEPVLSAWMKAVREKFGAFKGMATTDFSTNTKFENGVSIFETKGTANFEKGTARSELKLVGGQVTEFSLMNDSLPKDWIKGLSDKSKYRQQAEEFLTHFFKNEPDAAFAMMHPDLQKAMPLDTLRKLIEHNVAAAGPLKKVTAESDEFIDDEQRLLQITCHAEAEKGSFHPTVNFQFVALKGHMLGFDVNPKRQYAESFFAGVGAGDSQKVLELFHPALRQDVDELVLAAWIKAVQEKLGAYKRITPTGFTSTPRVVNDVTIIDIKGTVEFEKGRAPLEFGFIGDKIISMSLLPETIPGDWIKGLSDKSGYRQRAVDFLTHFFKNEPDAAFAMMHPDLQQAMPLDDLKALIEKNLEATGPLKEVTSESDAIHETEGSVLIVTCQAETENVTLHPTVSFQFRGFKGHMLGFNINPQKEADPKPNE